MTVPRCGGEARVSPSCLDHCAVPTAAVVQDKDESALITSPGTLHDVEIVIDEQNLRRSAGVLFVHFDERVNAALIIGLSKVPVEVILPEDAWVTFVSQDKGVGKELVVDNRAVADNIVVLDKCDGLCWPVPHQHARFSEGAEAEAIAIAQIAQTPSQREIKGADRIVRPCVCFIEPIANRALAVPTFADGERFEADAVAQRAQFLNRTNHPAPITLDHVVTETVETDFFQ